MPETEIGNLSGVHRFWRILGIVVSVCLALYAFPVLAAPPAERYWPRVSVTFTVAFEGTFAVLRA